MARNFLANLAEQLKKDKRPAHRRAIQKALSLVESKRECGMYESPSEAERDLRNLVEDACRV
jgi:hypothetical protein